MLGSALTGLGVPMLTVLTGYTQPEGELLHSGGIFYGTIACWNRQRHVKGVARPIRRRCVVCTHNKPMAESPARRSSRHRGSLDQTLPWYCLAPIPALYPIPVLRNADSHPLESHFIVK